MFWGKKLKMKSKLIIGIIIFISVVQILSCGPAGFLLRSFTAETWVLASTRVTSARVLGSRALLPATRVSTNGILANLVINSSERNALKYAAATIIPELPELGAIYELKALRVSVAKNSNPKLFLNYNGKALFFGEIESNGIINVLGNKSIRLNTSIYTTKTESAKVFSVSNPLKVISKINNSGKIILQLGKVPGGMYKVFIPADEVFGLMNISELLLLSLASGIISDQKFVTCDLCKGEGSEICSTCHKNKIVLCNSCNGERFIKCKNNCDKGLILCEICKGQGNHNCNGCNGNQKTICRSCNYNGKNVCTTCSAVGWIICSNCFSSGYTKCTKCDGYKYILK